MKWSLLLPSRKALPAETSGRGLLALCCQEVRFESQCVGWCLPSWISTKKTFPSVSCLALLPCQTPLGWGFWTETCLPCMPLWPGPWRHLPLLEVHPASPDTVRSKAALWAWARGAAAELFHCCQLLGVRVPEHRQGGLSVCLGWWGRH